MNRSAKCVLFSMIAILQPTAVAFADALNTESVFYAADVGQPDDAPMVYCEGTRCGDGGPRAFAYRVDSASYPMMSFRVGTNDLVDDRYTNVLTPLNWQFAVEPQPMGHLHGVTTPHGTVSPGPCRCLTRGSVHWWTDDPKDAVEGFTFGFDHPWRAEDVSWTLETRREDTPPQLYTFREDWDAAVGTGYGPVHGPLPEPGTALLLAPNGFVASSGEL